MKNNDDDDDNDDDINREDIKDLMETLSLSQRAKNKRKHQFDNDDEENDDDNDEKQSRSVHSKYRGNIQRVHLDDALIVLRVAFQPVAVVFIEISMQHRIKRHVNGQETPTNRR